MPFGCPHGSTERNSPVENRVLTIEKDKRIRRLKETIEAMETLLEELSPEELEYLRAVSNCIGHTSFSLIHRILHPS